MKNIAHYIVFSFVFFVGMQSVTAQSKSIKKGNNYFDKGEYFQALQAYNIAIQQGETLSTDALKKVGTCYFELNNIDQAFSTFSEIQDELSGNEVLTYAMVLHKVGFYSGEGSAIEWYEKAKKEGANPMKVNELIKSCEWAAENTDLVDYRVNPTTIFTFGQSFGIQYYKEGVVYSSSSNDDSQRKVDKQGKSFLDLYFSKLIDNEIQPGQLFSKKLEFPYHIGAISFTSDYNTMYYTLSVRIRGESKLKIFKVTYDGEDWGNQTELSINSDEYDCATPAVSPDDKYLYFVSNRKGGYGGKDIYRVERLRGGMYGKAINLGPEINTFGNEEFPFVSKENELYFSSDGHYGFGGLDLFRAKYIDGTWKNATNLLQPFNSTKDDFAYVINPKDPQRGFLSSNRLGEGDADAIFYVEYTGEPEVEEPKVGDVIVLEELPVEEPAVDLSMFPASLTAKIKSTFNNEAVSGINAEIIDDITGNVIASGISDSDGKFNISIPDNYKKDGQEFELVFSKDGEYNSKRMIVNIMEIADLNANGLTMTPIFNDEVLDDISGMVLYYVGDELTEESKKTLNRLAAYLQKNQQIVVKLNSHTDARGRKLDNLIASQNMGEKVEGLLQERGVNGDAMIPRGYGERYVVNKCKRGVLCSSEEQLKNRRIEVVVWKVNK
ncbi:flagellar motor protein MotB [Labilibacter sediminis]|nr:flagellar motor protein MotB [Labilibacter sediminis]